jgi:6-phosphogluconolactonase
VTTRIKVVDDLAAAALAAFLANARAALAEGSCHIALSGGSTPKILYQTLKAQDLPWEKVELFFGDERVVPLDDERSNFRMVKEALLARVEVKVHPLVEARAYETLLGEKLGPTGAFDLLLLGMGDDGHTASLFPGSPALTESAHWVVEAPGVAPAPLRLTVTPPVIRAAKRILVLVGGASKAAVLKEVLEGPKGRYPSQLVLDAPGEVTWLVDRAAASQLLAQ